MVSPGADASLRSRTAGADALFGWLERIHFRRWAHFLPLPLASFDPAAPHADALLAAARGVASAFGILAFGYLLNSVADRGMDLDARKNPFVGPSSYEYRYSLAGLLAGTGVLAVLSPWPARIAIAVCMVLATLYSIGPRLKRLPVAGSLTNAFGFPFLLFLGMPAASLPAGFTALAIAFTALLFENQLIHEAADRIEDQAGGIRTSWLTLGSRWTALLVALSGFTAIGAAASVVPVARWLVAIALATAVFGLAFPILLAWRGMEPRRAAQLRLAHRWCAAAFGAFVYAVWRAHSP
jgi:4-hydroxybenzoate polyprenyltransferase